MPTKRKIYLKEDVSDVLLPKFIFNALKTHSTSLGDNDAFPIVSDVPFDYKIIKEGYVNVVEKAKSFGIFGKGCDELETMLSNLLSECKKQETPIRDFLVRECEKMINNTFSIPKESIIMKYSLQDEITSDKPMRIFQEDMGNFKFEDAEDAEEFVKEVGKRRVIDSLIQGAASTLSEMMLNEFGREGQAYQLKDRYEKINAINGYLLYIKKEEISEKNPMQGGYVEVKLGMDGNKTTISAQGLIFPFLLREAVKGLFEVFSAHGLPQDKRRAQAIVRRSDFILAEPWDMRFGNVLYSKIFSNVEEYDLLPYMFVNLTSLDTENFNKFMKDVLSDSNSGEHAIDWLQSISIDDMEDDSSLEKEPSRDDSKGVLSDDIDNDSMVVEEGDYLTQDELNDMNVSEEEDLKCDPIQLADADVKDIFFEFENFNGMLYATILLGDCKFSKKDGISFMAEHKPRIGNNMFQLHISLDERLRRNGIATKLYQAFITKCGDIVSLYSNRVGTYAKGQGKEIPLDSSIDKIFKHLSTLPNVKVEKVFSNDGKELGVSAEYKAE